MSPAAADRRACPALPRACLAPVSPVLEGWARGAAAGDAAVEAVLADCLLRFRLAHACVFVEDPAPGWRALVRVFRGAAALRADGLVRSAELFRIRDPDAFLADPAERAATLAETAWDDRAALFSPRPPPRRVREAPPGLDHGGAAALEALPEQVRRFELLLNRGLHRHPGAGRVLAPPPPRGAGGAVSVDPLRAMLPGARASFAAALSEAVRGEAAGALAAFRARLDPERLRALDRAGANGVAAYNWLCGQGRGGADAASSRPRLQAALAYPFAWGLLSAPRGPVPEALEARLPLAPALAAALRVGEAAVRRMNGLGAEEAGGIGPLDPAAAARAAARAARMPPGAPPRTPAGWRAFFSAVDLADAAARLGAAEAPALLAASGGRWDALDPGALAQAADGLADMARDFHANAAVPAASALGLPAWPLARSARLLAGERPLDRLARACAWWHEHQVAVRARLAAAFPPADRALDRARWPALHEGEWRAPNGPVVVCLRDEGMLAEEHARMGHCVNTYGPACLYGGAHVVSVRAPSGESLGTAEIAQRALLAVARGLAEPPDAPLFSLPPAVVQFRSRGNGRPPAEAWEALWHYVGAAMTGALELDAAALEADLAARRASRGRAPSATCYDASRPGAVDEAWRLYAPAMPKSLARRGPRGLLASPGSPAPGGIPGPPASGG